MTESDDVEHYRYQITLARSEIKNLRQQISALKHEHQKEIKQIKSNLSALRCASCTDAASRVATNGESEPTSPEARDLIIYSPIGFIETSFQNKRAVPRQPSVLQKSTGAVVIDTSVFNNPEHALDGLAEFSHMWIIFHFHNTESNNSPAKVAPPRLQGERKGVFSTRSPHRPCRIGLSLVKIQSLEGNRINFLGVDMINGTPVLDIKPYIPQYDYPSPTYSELSSQTRPRTEGTGDTQRLLAGVQSPSMDIGSPIRSPYEGEIPSPLTQDSNLATPVSPPPVSPSSDEVGRVYTSPITRFDNERGAPDGQERFTPPQMPFIPSQDGIRVAPWIENPPAQRFQVQFTDDALARLNELIGDRAPAFKSNIETLLSEDPRSNYVRNRYPDHEYSCVLEDMSISCVFNAASSVCTIVAVRNADDMQQQN